MRKQRKLSQQQLADDLGVKRSNIAAYETKNVEPRLALINEMAMYFSVPLEDLVISDLKQLHLDGATGGHRNDHGLPSTSVDEIAQLSGKIHRMLDGFKVFYEFKKKMNEADTDTPVGDIDNFLTFINHMLEYNRLIENIVKTNERRAVSPPPAEPEEKANQSIEEVITVS
ncbi:helix-turn-helix transcriptional regulator [Lewinella sp. IMCC34191]|uniref:helix-turn-helix transcriptional regulator n=1 Tax=Lewinella sp. IMCC34191 TaxID=2259172 RepID=UPI00130091B7|nr:helix-turn-helix transcriptional regulator [Lewinella sp. IMCC34191]